ncbi:hypothetical protein INR49_021744 [Caranx melampygus]|nr:hypothetical protein INR49_021744 [Caranx melampygus]
MRYEAKMMPMFLTVYLSNNDQHFTEVPVTPETLCRDVVDLCKEPGRQTATCLRCGGDLSEL